MPVECTRPPDEGGNRRSSEVIRGHQSLPVECTRPPLRAVVSASLRRCAHAHYAPACERRECHAPWPCASPLRSSSVASILSSPWKHAPDEGGNHLSSEVIRGHQRSSEVIRWSSAWKHAPDEGGNHLLDTRTRHSGVITGNQATLSSPPSDRTLLSASRCRRVSHLVHGESRMNHAQRRDTKARTARYKGELLTLRSKRLKLSCHQKGKVKSSQVKSGHHKGKESMRDANSGDN